MVTRVLRKIHYTATKHGDHLLRALPAIAGGQKQVILEHKEKLVSDDYGGDHDSLESDPPNWETDENSNPSVDSGVSSTNELFLQKYKQFQQQQLQQFQTRLQLKSTGDIKEDLIPKYPNNPLRVLSQKPELLTLKPAHKPEMATGKPVFVIKSVQALNQSVIKRNTNVNNKVKQEPVVEEKPTVKRNMSKPEPNGFQPTSQDGQPLCAVCGEKAGRHSYYGGQVCASCRAFFRRAVQSRCHEIFCCVNGSDNCEITVFTRKNCQFCRYEKCLKSGMRPNWILSEEERVRRFHGRRKRKNRDPLNMPDSPDSPGSPGTPPNGHSDPSRHNLEPAPKVLCPSLKPLTLDETSAIEQLADAILQQSTGHTEDIDDSLLTDLLQSTLQGGQLSRRTMDRVANVINNRTKLCLTMIKDFQDLCENDRQTIFRHNVPLLHRLRQALAVTNPALTLSEFVKLLIGESRLHGAESLLPFDLSSKRHEYSTTSSGGKVDYMQILFQHRKNDPTSIELVYKLSKIVDLEDYISLVLLIMIVAFNTDFIHLEQREKVEEIQLKYVCLLQRYLNSNQYLPLNLAVATNYDSDMQDEPMNLAVNKDKGGDKDINMFVDSSIKTRQNRKFLVDFLLVPSILQQIHEISPDNLYF